MSKLKPETPPAKPDQIFKGIAYACTAFFLFTLMNALSKTLTGIHDAIEIGFYRNLLCVLPCICYIVAKRKYDLLKSKMPVTLGIRVGIGTVGLVLTLAAAQHLPLADATVLFFTSTLIIPVLAHFYLKERIGWPRWAAVFVGFTGVLLVAHPSGDVSALGVALALGAAVVHASIQVLIRAMKSENPFTITFYFFLIGTIGPGLFMPFIAHMPTPEVIPALLGIGLTGGMGQYFITRGFQMAPASLLGPFNFTGLLWATLLDIAIWGYIPGWPVFAGSAIIIASKLFILYRERRAARQYKT